MALTTDDLGAQAERVLDLAAVTGRGLLETGQGLLDTAGGLVATSGALTALAGGLASDATELAAELAGEAGERITRLGEVVSGATSGHVVPVVRSTSRDLRQNRLALILLALTLVGLVVALRRRRGAASKEERPSPVTTVSEPDRQVANG